MGSLFEIRSSLHGTYEWAMSSWGHSYQTSSGKQHPLHHQPSWCYGCQALAASEKLVTVSDVYRELFQRRLGNLSPEEFQRIDDQPEKRERLVVRLTATKSESGFADYLAMVRDRISSARCLTCGSTDLEFLDSKDTDRNIHLRSGELLTLTITGFAQIWGGFGLYSPEGERVGDSDYQGPG